MAYDVASAVAKYATPKAPASTGYDVNAALAKMGIQPKTDLTTIGGLQAYATQQGFGKEASRIVDETPKLSFLQRLGSGLGAFNPAEAILTGTEKGAAQGALSYVTGIGKGVGSAITGTDYQENRRYFSDVADKAGITNGIAKFGIGFLGDVLLDPTTYFGGAIARGIGFTVKQGANLTLKGVGKVAPGVEDAARLAGTELKDAFGKAFVVGYKSTEGAREDVLTFLSKRDQARIGLAASNQNRLGTGILTEDQSKQLVSSFFVPTRIKELESRLPPSKGGTFVTPAKKEEELILQEIGFLQDAIYDHPGRGIGKFLNWRTGEFIKGGDVKAMEQIGQDLSKSGDIDEVLKLGQDYQKLKTALDAAKERLKGTRAAPKTGITLVGIGTAKEFAEADGKKIIAGMDKLPLNEQVKLDMNLHDRYIAVSKNKSAIDNLRKDSIEKQKILDIFEGKNQNPTDIEKAIKLLTEDQETHRFWATRGGRFGGKEWNNHWVKVYDNWKSNLTSLAKLSYETPSAAKTLTTAQEIQAEALSKLPAEIRAIAEAQIARSKKFAKAINIENPYETYFPFIKKDKLEKFFKDTTARNIKVGSEAYLKEFRNLVTDENLETNLVKAFFTREAAQVTDTMSRDFLEGFAKKYGKPINAFKDSDKAAEEGYKAIREKGILGKLVGWGKVDDVRLLDNLINPEFQSINMMAKATGFDAITNLFKRSVTGLFLPFHIRNYVSGIIQNYEALGIGALNPKTIAAGQKMAYLLSTGKGAKGGLIMVKGQPEKFARVFDSFANRFGSDTFFQHEFLQSVDTGTEIASVSPVFGKQSLKTTVKTLGFGSTGIPFRAGRAVGQFIEYQQKAVAYLTALGQGKSIPESLKMAERAGFDYRSLTAFESQIMRRIIPFYSFTRKNIELQLKTLGESPQRINQVLAFFKNIGEQPSAEEKKDLPDYIRSSIGIKMADLPNGLKVYISNFGTPIEQFANLVNGNPILFAISMTNPMLKAPIELGIGKDSFRQRDLKDVYDAKEYSAAPQIIKDLLELKEVKKPVLQKNAFGKLVKVGERTEYVSNPTRLLIARSLFTSRGFSWFDQIFDGDMEGLAKWMKVTTGIKPQEVNTELSKALKERDQKRALEDLNIKIGGAANYSRLYVPKNR